MQRVARRPTSQANQGRRREADAFAPVSGRDLVHAEAQAVGAGVGLHLQRRKAARVQVGQHVAEEGFEAAEDDFADGGDGRGKAHAIAVFGGDDFGPGRPA